MADQKHKTPEELGEAVGKKIEELFGGMFSDEPAPAESQSVFVKSGSADRSPAANKTASGPVPGSQSQTSSQPVQEAKSAASIRSFQNKDFKEIIDQIEALFLALDWEISPEAVKELGNHLRSLDAYLPQDGPAKTIVNMNLRVLPLFSDSEVTPHPAWIKLLQDSVAALVEIHQTGGKQPSPNLISSITANYKEISAAFKGASVKAALRQSSGAQTSQLEVAGNSGVPTGLRKLNEAIRSMKEVSQRLSRILGVLRQGGAMAPEDVVRRLGTIEHLLGERLANLEEVFLESRDQDISNSQSSANGLLLVIWNGVMLAIPETIVEGVYPLPRPQAEAFSKKSEITIAGKTIARLPLKKPKGAPETIPSWLVQFRAETKNCFILAEKMIGYRKAPNGFDVESQPRLKIGPTLYTVINRALLK